MTAVWILEDSPWSNLPYMRSEGRACGSSATGQCHGQALSQYSAGLTTASVELVIDKDI